jgi:hypothetical protein
LLLPAGLLAAPVVPDRAEPQRFRPVALRPERVIESEASEEGLSSFFYREPSKRISPGVLRLRLAVEDPDGSLAGLNASVSGGPPVLLDGGGKVEGREATGFGDPEASPYVDVPMPPRGGPHRLDLRPVPYGDQPAHRWTVQVRILGGRFFDPRHAFEGMRDLADLLRRRYNILRDLDLVVRQRDATIPPLDPEWKSQWHGKDTFEAHLGEAVGRHVTALNTLTFRSHRQKADPVSYLWAALAEFQDLYRLWHESPEGGRAGWLYAAGPSLYEYLDEVSQSFAGIRESSYKLMGLTCCDEGDPVGRARRMTREARKRLQALIDMTRIVHAELEDRAELLAGNEQITTLDFPAIEAWCRRARALPPPPPVEREGYRAVERSLEGFYYVDRPSHSAQEPAGVARGHGPTCGVCPPERRKVRDVRVDRYRPERETLTSYLNRIRTLAQHDLQLVRLWQALLAGRTSGAGIVVRAPNWKAAALQRLRHKARERKPIR